MANNKLKKRCEHDIIASILNVSKEGATRTKIMYGANLSFALLNKYLRVLIDSNLLENQKKERGIVYVLSKKGRNFLSSYYELQLSIQNGIKKNT